jgi:hypothetical protein
MQEEDFCLLALGGQRRIHVGGVDGPLKRWIGQHHVVQSFFVEGLRYRIGVAKVGRLDAVQHHVHAADAEHGHAGIIIVAGQSLRLKELVLVGA